MKIVAAKKLKKDMTRTFFSPLSFVAVLDLGSEIRDPGSGMGKNRIRDNHPGSAALVSMRKCDMA